MNREFAIYPFEFMNITQNWNQGNHVPHWKGVTNWSDKPWDEGCKDGGRSYFVPQNDYVVEEVLGIDGSSTNAYTNTVRLKSVNKLYIPFKEEPDYLYLTLTHINEDNLREVHQGQVLTKGTKLLLEGTDGYATGNHFHMTANLGKYWGFKKNSNGVWCYTYDKSLIPEEAFYVDTEFTTIRGTNGSAFKNVPIEEPQETPKEAPEQTKEEDRPIAPTDTETRENGEITKEKWHIIKLIVGFFVNLLKKIFKMN